MSAGRASRPVGRAAFLLGLVLAAAVVAAGRVPGGDGPLDARLTLAASATGGLAVSPDGRVLAARRLAPGTRPARGRVRLLNQTSSPVSVLVRIGSQERDLDKSVRLELRTGQGRPVRATLGRLRSWQPLGPALAPHRRERVSVRLWIPASVRGGHEARRANVTLEFLRKGARA